MLGLLKSLLSPKTRKPVRVIRAFQPSISLLGAPSYSYEGAPHPLRPLIFDERTIEEGFRILNQGATPPVLIDERTGLGNPPCKNNDLGKVI